MNIIYEPREAKQLNEMGRILKFLVEFCGSPFRCRECGNFWECRKLLEVAEEMEGAKVDDSRN